MSGPRLSIIPAGAVTDARLEGRDLQVLALLGSHIDEAGWCFRSQARMAKQIGCGRATVQRSLDRLEQAGWLARRAETRRDGGDTANSYRVILDVLDVEMGAPAPDGAPDSVTPASPMRQGGASPVRRGPPAHERAPIGTTPNERIERERGREDWDEKGLGEFRTMWPRTAIDDPTAVDAAWRALSPEDRKAALAGVPVFLEALKAQRQSHVPGGANYLAKRRWEPAVGAAVSQAEAAAKTTSTYCPAWSRRWWALVVHRLKAGETKRARMMLGLAEGGTGGSAGPGEVDLEAADAMKGFPSDGEVVGRWRGWFERRGVMLPVWRDKPFWVFLPSVDPPFEAGETEDGDDDRLAG